MARIDQLLESYRRRVSLPPQKNLPLSQRVWFVVYPPEDERRMANRITDFEIATRDRAWGWQHLDFTSAFADWMDTFDAEEREACLAEPDIVENYADPGFLDFLTDRLRQALQSVPTDQAERTLFAVTGLMELYDFVHVSDILSPLESHLQGIVVLFFPLKNALAAALAAEETLNFKGQPTTDEGREARKAIMTRKTAEDDRVASLMAEVVGAARLFLSGGQELGVITLRAAVETAAQQVLDRLYPKFHPADSANWPTVWKKAKEGNGNALNAVQYAGDPHKHVVTAAILAHIGAGKTGSEVEAHFTGGGAGYGWPKDAVDAGLAVLLVSEHINARIQSTGAGPSRPVRGETPRLQGQVTLADLDQRKIGQAEFRVQHPVLTPVQKLRIKKLFQEAGHKFEPGQEGVAAPGFVQALRQLARAAGGEPPAPAAPTVPELTALEGQIGNDLLFALFEKADDFAQRIGEWKAVAEKIKARLPVFTLAESLLAHAQSLEGMAEQAANLAAIRANRSLLDDPDPTATVLKIVATALRAALKQAADQYAATLAAERAKLDANAVWKVLPEAKQASLLRSRGVSPRPLPATGTEAELLAALQAQDLAAWQTQTDALPTRCAQALAAAIKEAEPKATRVSLPSATIHDQAELEQWLAEARTKIEAALGLGPVIL